MGAYRRKGTIEAEQWERGQPIYGLTAPAATPDKITLSLGGQEIPIVPGDYIMKDSRGNLIPMGKRMFEQMYEPADVPAARPIQAAPSPINMRPTFHKRAHEDLPKSKPIVAGFRRLLVDGVEGDQFNPGLCVHNGTLFASVRTMRGQATHNYLGPLRDGGTLRARELRPPPAWDGTDLEDLRLVSWHGRLWATAVAVGGVLAEGRIVQVLCDLGPRGERIESVHPMLTPWTEKNWMPCVDGAGDLRLVYSVEPLVVLNLGGGPIPSFSTARAIPGGHLRGSSPLIPWGDGFLAVLHEQCHRAMEKPIYLHRFARFDAALTRVDLGRHFHFFAPDVEFVAGIVSRDGGLTMSFGVKDKEAWLADVEGEALVGLIPE